MINKFKQFIDNTEDKHEPFYITGPAGSGKTHSLAELTEHLTTIGLKFVVCAFTHTACEILSSKLSTNVEIRTLHSVLRKRPTINDSATKSQHIEYNAQCGTPNVYDLIIVDEAYMVCDVDIADINYTCEDPDTGETRTKVVYVGDMNQLPPINGPISLVPEGKWWCKLTKIWRQKEDNELLDLLCKLVSYIDGSAEPQALEANKNFIRGIDIAEKSKCMQNKIVLAYTNARVETLNAEIQGYDEPKKLDLVFSPTRREKYLVKSILSNKSISSITKAYGDDELKLGSKYKALEYLLSMQDITFYDLSDDKDKITTHAVIFGHYQYKLYDDKLKNEAADANKACSKLTTGNIQSWCQTNRSHTAAKRRAKAWRDYLTFRDCVICLDFNHAKTVHKSQGSTYENVLIDTQDLYLCAARDFNLYLRLMYVAISRSSGTVYTN